MIGFAFTSQRMWREFLKPIAWRSNEQVMTGPKGSSDFCSPETLNVFRGEAEGSNEGGRGKKLTVSRVASR